MYKIYNFFPFSIYFSFPFSVLHLINQNVMKSKVQCLHLISRTPVQPNNLVLSLILLPVCVSVPYVQNEKGTPGINLILQQSQMNKFRHNKRSVLKRALMISNKNVIVINQIQKMWLQRGWLMSPFVQRHVCQVVFALNAPFAIHIVQGALLN